MTTLEYARDLSTDGQTPPARVLAIATLAVAEELRAIRSQLEALLLRRDR